MCAQSPLGAGGGKGKAGTVNIDASGGMGRQLNDDYYAHTDASKAFQQARLCRQKLLSALCVIAPDGWGRGGRGPGCPPPPRPDLHMLASPGLLLLAAVPTSAPLSQARRCAGVRGRQAAAGQGAGQHREGGGHHEGHRGGPGRQAQGARRPDHGHRREGAGQRGGRSQLLVQGPGLTQACRADGRREQGPAHQQHEAQGAGHQGGLLRSSLCEPCACADRAAWRRCARHATSAWMWCSSASCWPSRSTSSTWSAARSPPRSRRDEGAAAALVFADVCCNKRPIGCVSASWQTLLSQACQSAPRCSIARCCCFAAAVKPTGHGPGSLLAESAVVGL